MVDPLERWRELGLPDKPDYAGLLTYAGMPYTQDPAAPPARGMDVVDVLPTATGSAGVTALVAVRVVREALTGLAHSRR